MLLLLTCFSYIYIYTNLIFSQMSHLFMNCCCLIICYPLGWMGWRFVLLEWVSSGLAWFRSVGVSTRYIYATYLQEECIAGRLQRRCVEVCIFLLSNQQSLDSDDCVGFRLLLGLPPPPVWTSFKVAVISAALVNQFIYPFHFLIFLYLWPKLTLLDVMLLSH